MSLRRSARTRRTLVRSAAAMCISAATLGFGAVAVPSTAGADTFPITTPGWPGQVSGFTYQTEGATPGSRAEATALMLVPNGPAPEGGWPVMLFNRGMTGAAAQCGMTRNDDPLEMSIIGHWVERGYATIVPDLIGMGTSDVPYNPFLHTSSEITNTADALRAAHALRGDLSKTWMSAGVSGGGHATLAISPTAQQLLPEYDFRGTLAIEPAANIHLIQHVMRPGLPPSEITQGLASISLLVYSGLRLTRPDLAPQMDALLTPEGQKAMEDIEGACIQDWERLAEGRNTANLWNAPRRLGAGDRPGTERLHGAADQRLQQARDDGAGPDRLHGPGSAADRPGRGHGRPGSADRAQGLPR